MPRKPRIELAGYHHIINRGVNRSVVFVDDDDYEMFLKIVCKACRVYGVVLHDYIYNIYRGQTLNIHLKYAIIQKTKHIRSKKCHESQE